MNAYISYLCDRYININVTNIGKVYLFFIFFMNLVIIPLFCMFFLYIYELYSHNYLCMKIVDNNIYSILFYSAYTGSSHRTGSRVRGAGSGGSQSGGEAGLAGCHHCTHTVCGRQCTGWTGGAAAIADTATEE